MKLLNSKSILECDEFEEKIHNKETQEILEGLLKYPNYDCAAIIKYFDEANKDKEPIIKQCELHSCDEMIEYVYFKNGVDLALVEGARGTTTKPRNSGEHKGPPAESA